MNLQFIQFTSFFVCKEFVTDSFPALKSARKAFKLAELTKNLPGAAESTVLITSLFKNAKRITAPFYI